MAVIRVIGVGNEFRGDDAVGLIVASRLREQLPKSIEIIEHTGDGATLMDAWEGADRVYIIDAVKSGA
ncbi:MAG: hydrogenase maturation protease, partial [bacterium]|nr:hydrogenase maturation protease [bacterium]